MSLQIKKPLSAQAVGTDMYKNGGVSQIKPATKQPEWITKCLKYGGETEKKTTPNVQHVQPDMKHMALKRWWSVWDQTIRSVVQLAVDRNWIVQAQRIWFFSPCDAELSFRERIFLTEG